MTSIRELERASIEKFLRDHADCFVGRVLDMGCGLQPYRDLVEEQGAEYVPYDRAEFPGSTVVMDVGEDPRAGLEEFDAIICTQVIQYLDPAKQYYDESNPTAFLSWLGSLLVPNGQSTLLMTGPTNWPIVEEQDYWRPTPNGIKRMLRATAWFNEIVVEPRAEVEFQGEHWLLGWQAFAR